MLLKEYNEEFHISCEKKISYEDGYEDGVKQEKAQADQARHEAEEARREADEARRKADEADQKADEACREAGRANQKIEILTRKLRGSSEEEIAAALHLPAETVRECIRAALGDDMICGKYSEKKDAL